MDPTSGKPLAKNELLKADKPDLSGTIRETLANPAADRFSGDDEQFIKFHGIYQQDDRDKRKVAKEYSVMVRTRQTGGIVPAAQYLVYDELSGRFANGTLRITSRQTFQFHGVLQQGIGSLIKSINEALSSTLATCEALALGLKSGLDMETALAILNLIIADRFGGAIIRASQQFQVSAARRKSMLIRFARSAAERIARLNTELPIP